ncbi:MAG: class I SAM-dependent methyltransferase [Cyanomargarita calcarea GSE-NOS-MK-12-04C]|uniref:Class I SAM-dependent methyltransferase n=1 Tax=Cyanomargarita calcarea GSE-NOS-MK-12-04C TaxID=2839659 RepID=A0A951QHV3_9CYAN|nr:class I SAM-dependent methyltransferase [Cyanomargarita calcarea GSE-NOS-MK-12-04C]
MQNQKSSIIFDQERASSYDERFAKLAPLRDALHLLIHLVLSELPADARILCVGVGTGSELINLAQRFPEWQFTAVEPAAPMLDICRQRAEEYGIASRCTFHEGYLDSLPASPCFDAATCLLVSHFFVQLPERRNFFSQIASRVCPNGYLVSSDLSSDMSTPAYKSLLEVWLRMLKYSEVPAEEIEKFRASYGRDTAVLPPLEVESIIASSGFDTPVLFFQTLLIHAWYAKRTPLS